MDTLDRSIQINSFVPGYSEHTKLEQSILVINKDLTVIDLGLLTINFFEELNYFLKRTLENEKGIAFYSKSLFTSMIMDFVYLLNIPPIEAIERLTTLPRINEICNYIFMYKLRELDELKAIYVKYSLSIFQKIRSQIPIRLNTSYKPHHVGLDYVVIMEGRTCLVNTPKSMDLT